jgi:hypothetical protein
MYTIKKVISKLFFCYPNKDELKDALLFPKKDSPKYTIGGCQLRFKD